MGKPRRRNDRRKAPHGAEDACRDLTPEQQIVEPRCWERSHFLAHIRVMTLVLGPRLPSARRYGSRGIRRSDATRQHMEVDHQSVRAPPGEAVGLAVADRGDRGCHHKI